MRHKQLSGVFAATVLACLLLLNVDTALRAQAQALLMGSFGNVSKVVTTDSSGNLNVVVTGGSETVTNVTVSGRLFLGSAFLSALQPSVSSGFGSGALVTAGVGAAFRVNVGTGGVATSGVIAMGQTAPVGFNCSVDDLTTAASFVTVETASSTTLVTVGNFSRTTGLSIAWTASDILMMNCVAM